MALLRYVSKQTLLIIFTKIDTLREKRNIKIISGIHYSPTFSGLGKSIRAFTRDVNFPRSIFLLLYLTILENMPTVDSKTVLVARSDLTSPLGWEEAPPPPSPHQVDTGCKLAIFIKGCSLTLLSNKGEVFSTKFILA